MRNFQNFIKKTLDLKLFNNTIHVNIGACTTPPAPALSHFYPSLTHLISLSFLQIQQHLRPLLESLSHVDSKYTLIIDFDFLKE